MRGTDRYEDNVFINCPFDTQYKPLFRSAVYTVYDCGFIPRCALELDDSSQTRIDKIEELIEQCKYGIHDISRTGLDAANRLPRFNMPFELGLFLGAKRFGDERQQAKRCVILDKEKYRYQMFLSDISGQDIKSHGNEPRQLTGEIRDWLTNSSGRPTPGLNEMWQRYGRFSQDLPLMLAKTKVLLSEMTFNEYRLLIQGWLKVNTL